MYKMSGIDNFGNTCYVNSVVQLLRYTKPVVKPLVSVVPTKNGEPDEVLKSFLDLLYQGADAKKFVNSLDSLGFTQIMQHDAHEFFMTMIDKLYESVEPKNPFEGTFVSTLTCKNGHTSTSKEPFICLSINGGIEEGVKKLAAKEVVECKCDHCNEKTMTRKLRIQPGDAICFHMKRFDHTFRKLLYSVPVLKKWKGYKLVGMCNHFGSMHGGHYTSTVKTDEGWMVTNDERVHKLDTLPSESSLPYLMVYVRNK